jgi:hypothetical protein
MLRGIRTIRWLASAGVMLALAGCARKWVEEREAWRGEAEQACLRSGVVREGPSITIIKAINGPGVCGADYPLRVAALGEPAIAGFGDEVVRPPTTLSGIPNFPPAAPSGTYPQASYSRAYPQGAYPQGANPQGPYAAPASGEPLSIVPPGQPRQPGAPLRGAPGDGYAQSAPRDDYPYPPPQAAPDTAVPLGRSVAEPITAGPAAVTPAATLACPLVSKLDRFVTERVQPAALRWFGQPVVEIRQISAYSCRGMNGNPNAHISEHAFGNALDIAAFTFADGRKLTVKDGWHGAPEEQGFLRDVHAAACETFTTVLAPGSNAYHYDHMHLDLMRRASGRAICEPAAISGEVAAARAGGRYWRPGEPTGSLAADRQKSFLSRYLSDRPGSSGLPHAVAGAD